MVLFALIILGGRYSSFKSSQNVSKTQIDAILSLAPRDHDQFYITRLAFALLSMNAFSQLSATISLALFSLYLGFNQGQDRLLSGFEKNQSRVERAATMFFAMLLIA